MARTRVPAGDRTTMTEYVAPIVLSRMGFIFPTLWGTSIAGSASVARNTLARPIRPPQTVLARSRLSASIPARMASSSTAAGSLGFTLNAGSAHLGFCKLEPITHTAARGFRLTAVWRIRKNVLDHQAFQPVGNMSARGGLLDIGRDVLTFAGIRPLRDGR
jgi:hypothetical protein